MGLQLIIVVERKVGEKWLYSHCLGDSYISVNNFIADIGGNCGLPVDMDEESQLRESSDYSLNEPMWDLYSLNHSYFTLEEMENCFKCIKEHTYCPDRLEDCKKWLTSSIKEIKDFPEHKDLKNDDIRIIIGGHY